jgi:hypothetical protein
MKTIILLLFTTLSFAQSSVIVAGGNAQNISYTIGGGLVELQISIVEEVTLGVPKFELPEPPKPKPATKKKSFLEKLIEVILKLFKKNNLCQ